ncbi:MAG: hypothetical protein AAF236_03970 [Verrucomicrobiota bacterium]
MSDDEIEGVDEAVGFCMDRIFGADVGGEKGPALPSLIADRP